MSSTTCENNDQDSIDVERLVIELEKFEKLLKDGEESDGGEGVEANSLQSVPSFLDKYLMSIAKTGDPLLPWKKVKTFIHHKIDSILTSFYEKYGTEDVDSQNIPPFNYIPAKEKLLQHFDSFTGAPFTIQRLCEILIDPGRHYRRTEKLLRGLEKNILVVSTIGRLSEDCSNPQQRLMLFNGLQLTTNSFRSYRPPLPHTVDKFQSPTKDDEEGSPGSRKRPANGDEASAMDEDEESFDDECLKQDLDDEQIEDMDDIHPKLGNEGTDSESDNYGLSINPAMWRKRKEEPLEDGQTKKIKLSDDDSSLGSASSSPSNSRLTTIEKALDEVACEATSDDNAMEVDEARPPPTTDSPDKSEEESRSYKVNSASETDEKAMSPTPEVQKEESSSGSPTCDAQSSEIAQQDDASDSQKSSAEEEKPAGPTPDDVKSQSENNSSSETSEEKEEKSEAAVGTEDGSGETATATQEAPSVDGASSAATETEQNTGAEATAQEESKHEE